MEENEAHSYYVDLKNKGSGAAMFKEGLGFDKGVAGSGQHGGIQFVAQKGSQQGEQQQPSDSSPAEAPPPWHSVAPRQGASQWGSSNMQQQMQRPAAGSQHPVAGVMTPHRPQTQHGQAATPHMPGPPPRGPASHQHLQPGPRGFPPRGPYSTPMGGMPPGVFAQGHPQAGLPRPPPGMRPPGMLQPFPGGAPPPGHPLHRPPMGTPPRPPPQGWGQPPHGLGRPQHMMPQPMQQAPPSNLGPRPQPPHPGQLLPPPSQQWQQGPPQQTQQQRPHHPPFQQQPQQQQPTALQHQLPQVAPARPPAAAAPPVQGSARDPPSAQHTASPAPAAVRQDSAHTPPVTATSTPTTGGWMAHRSESGQVYYHNPSTRESSWQKPEGFEGDAESAGAAPRPVSSNQIPNTGWSEVTCSDGRKYYYHAKREETSWSKPPEVATALANVIKVGGSKKAGMTADQVAIIARLKANNAQLNLRPELRETEENDANDDVTFSDSDIGGTAPPLPPQAPPLPVGVPPMTPMMGSSMRPMPFPGPYPGRPPMHLPLVPAARSHGQLVQDFKDLLLEVKVTPFSRWERELPKLVADQRYKAIDKPKERRQIFDDFCRNVAEEQKLSKQRKEQQAAAAQPAFLALLDEAQALAQHPHQPPSPPVGEGNDGEGEEEGEAEPYNKRDKDEVPSKALTGDSRPSDMEDAWGDDPRWQGTEEHVRERLLLERIEQLQADHQRAEEADRAAKEQAFRQLLVDSGVSLPARWSKTKDALRSDPRYKALPRPAREPAFKQYLAHLQAEEDTKGRDEAAVKEREAAAAKAQEDAKRRQQEAAHNDAVLGFQTLLAELVKDPYAQWKDWQGKLGKDPQKRADNKSLHERELRELFGMFIHNLRGQIQQGYRSLMDQKLRPLLPPQPFAELTGPLKNFKDAVPLLEADPRFERVAEPDRQKFWWGFVEEVRKQRDHPQQPDPRAIANSRAAERDRSRSAKDSGDVVDKAYVREYLEPDQKRVRRD